MQKKSSFVSIVIILVTVGLILTYSSIFTGNNANAPAQKDNQTKEQAASYSYQGQDGKTALELLKEKYQVDTRESEFGELVEGIDGIKADEANFWAYMVNGEMAMEGAGTYMTNNNDLIQWELVAIQ